MTGRSERRRPSVRRPGSSQPMAAVLVKRVPVKVRDISPVGCLLECTRSIPVGMSGCLHLDVDGGTFSDDIRVVRIQTPAGSGPDRKVGVELLPTRTFTHHSLRHAIREVMSGPMGDLGAPPVLKGRSERVESVVKSKRRTENHTARPPPDT
jgi:hypothetical protein